MPNIKEIVLDTETTGLDPNPSIHNPTGHRVIEIGAIELLGHIPTGKIFHRYINPEMIVPKESTKIHGIKTDDLLDKPTFESIADEFLSFIEDAVLIIHNAEFDLKFLNFELEKVKRPNLSSMTVIDTLQLARDKAPSRQNSLDALAKRYSIDASGREDFHGALVDSHILSQIYLELIGGSQPDFKLDNDRGSLESANVNYGVIKQRETALKSRITQTEIEAHKAFIASINAEKKWNY